MITKFTKYSLSKLVSFSLITCFSLSQLLFPIIIGAENFLIEMVTSDSSQEVILDIDGDNFAWLSGDNIYLYSNASVRQLTFDSQQNGFKNDSAKVDGDHVVWIRRTQNFNPDIPPQIYLYKISTQETFQITSDGLYDKFHPDIHNKKIVWVFIPMTNTSSGDKLMTYDIESGVFEEVVNEQVFLASIRRPTLYEDVLAWIWQTSGSNSQEIFVKDLSSGVITRLTNDNFEDTNLAVKDGFVAWSGYDGNDFEIYLYNGAEVAQLTDNSVNDGSFLAFSGQRLIWNFGTTSFNFEGNTVVYDLSSQLVESTIENSFAPKINGDRLVWRRMLTMTEVFTKNLTTGEITQVTQDGFLDGGPFPGDSLIAWVGRDQTGGSDVYIATPLPNQPPTVSANGPYEVNEGGIVQVSAIGEDPENGTLAYAWDLDNNGNFETSGQIVDFYATNLDPGEYAIAVQVTDDRSLTATDSATVTVIDVPTVDDFVLLGIDGIWVKSGVVINNGDVGSHIAGIGPFLDSGVETSIGVGVSMLGPDSQVYGNRVHLKNNSQVQDVYFNLLIGLGSVLGEQFTPITLPLVPFIPIVPSFSVGTNDIIVPQSSTQGLPAGNYNNLSVMSGATIIFEGGVYNFNSWDIRNNAKVYFAAPSEVRIANKLDTNQGAEVKPEPFSGISASDIVIFVTGINGNNGNIGATPKSANFGMQNKIEANIFVPNGTLETRSGTVAVGAFLGKWVVAGQNAEFTHDTSF